MARRGRRLNRRRRSIATQRRTLFIGAGVLVVALIAFLVVYFVMRNAVNKVAADIIWDNIYIETVDVSGMDAKKANKALEELAAKYKAQKITLVVEEAEAEVALEQLGFQMNKVDKLVEKAVNYGKKGSIWSRYQDIKDLDEKAIKLEVSYSIDEEATKTLISEKFSTLEGAAVNATLKRENGKFVITDGKAGIKVDVATSVQNIKEHFGKDWEFQGAESITLVTTVDEPDVTKEQLQQVKDVLGTFSTSFKANNNRGKNVANATSRINGTVLMPGEVMSASDSMGSRNAANGYLEAGSYLNGETVESYGGGVCQVSTTLYNAVILAELEITERSSHSMIVDYVKPSMDAAISEGVLDLKIKNNTEAPIYIEGYTNGGTLTFTVYGKEYRPASRKVSYVSETLSTTDPGKKFVATNDSIGTYKKAASAHMGIKAKLWKVVTENGTEVSREQFNKSSYKASPATYHVGVGTDNAEAAAIVNNAVKSQDEATIKAAIAQAQALIAAATNATPVEPAPDASQQQEVTPQPEATPQPTPEAQ